MLHFLIKRQLLELFQRLAERLAEIFEFFFEPSRGLLYSQMRGNSISAFLRELGLIKSRANNR
jgi:hypothetical protein